MAVRAEQIGAVSALHTTSEGVFQRIFSAAKTPLRRRMKYHQIVNELNAYSDRNLNDLGISRWDIERIAREGARGA